MCTDNHALDDPRPPFYLQVSFTRFVGYFLRLGTIGFGGPIALAGHMQQDLELTNVAGSAKKITLRGWL